MTKTTRTVLGLGVLGVLLFAVGAWSTSAASINLEKAQIALQGMQDDGGLIDYRCDADINHATMRRAYWRSIPDKLQPRVGAVLTRICFDQTHALATLIRDERGDALDYYSE